MGVWQTRPKAPNQVEPDAPQHIRMPKTQSTRLRPLPAPKLSARTAAKAGIKKIYPEPCKELRRRPQLFMVGSVPYCPSSTRVLSKWLTCLRQPDGGFRFRWAGRPAAWAAQGAAGASGPKRMTFLNAGALTSPHKRLRIILVVYIYILYMYM